MLFASRCGSIPASTNAAFFLVQNDCAITGTNFATATLIPRLPTLLPQTLQPRAPKYIQLHTAPLWNPDCLSYQYFFIIFVGEKCPVSIYFHHGQHRRSPHFLHDRTGISCPERKGLQRIFRGAGKTLKHDLSMYRICIDSDRFSYSRFIWIHLGRLFVASVW